MINFGKKEGKRISWIKPYTKIKDIKYSKEDVKIKWFYDGTLNVSANCIDRHLKKMVKKLLLFGKKLEMILLYLKKFHTKNYIKMFVKLQML